MKRKNNAARQHLSKVAELSCAACQRFGVQVHHIRTERIKSDFLTIPLCHEHHQGGFSIHNSKEQFTNIYGSEWQLLAKTIERLA